MYFVTHTSAMSTMASHCQIIIILSRIFHFYGVKFLIPAGNPESDEKKHEMKIIKFAQ